MAGFGTQPYGTSSFGGDGTPPAVPPGLVIHVITAQGPVAVTVHRKGTTGTLAINRKT